MVSRIVLSLAAVILALCTNVSLAQEKPAAYEAGNYDSLLGLPVFSEAALKNHFKLYQGYVKNVNILLEKLSAMAADGKEKTPEYTELKRRFGWEYDGMVMHELYFGAMAANMPVDPESALYKKIVVDFGSFDAWKKDFLATAAGRGIGWAVLYQESKNGRLINSWVNEHDCGFLAASNPLLVLDVFEHAFMPDYQTDRAAYLDAFFKVINWKAVEKRFK